MKKSQNNIVAQTAFPAQTPEREMKKDLSFRDCVEDSHAVSPEDDQEGHKKNDLKALREMLGKHLQPDKIAEICHLCGIDERDAFRFLAKNETGPIGKAYEMCYKMRIPASMILKDESVPGVEDDRVRRVFGVIQGRVEPYENEWISYDEATRWPTIKPELLPAYQEITRRLVQATRQAVIDAYLLADNLIYDRTSDFVLPTPEEMADALINDPDEMRDGLGVFLELEHGEYKHVPCKLIFDMAKSLEAGRDQVAPETNNHMEDEASTPTSPDTGMHGIASAFSPWIHGADDKTLAYIIKHHALPPGVGMLTFVGNGNDAKRFWTNVGMQPKEFNKCFGTKYKSNSGHAGQLDYDAKPDNGKQAVYKGMYIPLHQFGLIKSK